MIFCVCVGIFFLKYIDFFYICGKLVVIDFLNIDLDVRLKFRIYMV